MGKIKQLMMMIEETAADLVIDMDNEIEERIEDYKSDYRDMFYSHIMAMADEEGWTEEDLEVILEMSLEDIFDEAIFADSSYA